MNKPTKFELMRKNRDAIRAKQIVRYEFQAREQAAAMRDAMRRALVSSQQNVGLGGLAQGWQP